MIWRAVTYLVLRVPPLLAGPGGSRSDSMAEDALMRPCFWPASHQLLHIKDRLFTPTVSLKAGLQGQVQSALKWEEV